MHNAYKSFVVSSAAVFTLAMLLFECMQFCVCRQAKRGRKCEKSGNCATKHYHHHTYVRLNAFFSFSLSLSLDSFSKHHCHRERLHESVCTSNRNKFVQQDFFLSFSLPPVFGVFFIFHFLSLLFVFVVFFNAFWPTSSFSAPIQSW